jgi:PhnB protein
MATVSPIPEGYHTATPVLTVHDAAEALAFYGRAFGAQELMRAADPSGEKIWHAEMKIGDSIIMVNDEFPDMGSLSPRSLGGSANQIFLYVEDADSAWARAIDAGATVKFDIMDAFWGDRLGVVADPYGHAWVIATHTEDVSPEEAARRSEALYGGKQP